MAENDEGLSEPVTLDKTVVPEREIGMCNVYRTCVS